MKVLVTVKRVVDYNVRVRAKADGSGIATDGLKMSANPFDEVAVEEAVRLKEKGIATEVVAVSVGGDTAQETLRAALAIGADRAILVKAEGEVEPLGVARLLKAVVEKETPKLVLMGKQAIDGDFGQTPQMLAALLGWGQGLFASKVTIESGKAEVVREVDGGMETVSLVLPAVVAADLRLNEPRYAALPNIMKARKKPLEVLDAKSLGVDFAPHISLVSASEPTSTRKKEIFEDAASLAAKIKEIAGAL